MPKTPTAINFSKHRTRHLCLKYYDCLKKHLGHIERNLIGFGYTFDDDVLSHQIAVGDITATVIELDGELICLAEYQFDKDQFTHYKVLEWLERFDVHFQPEHCRENTLQNASRILTGVRFRNTCIIVYRKGHGSIPFDPEALDIVTSEIDAFTDKWSDFDFTQIELEVD
ncbi:MAG: hypothetical protein JJE30_10955 [Desulfuromonadales bacterium]|nr:hypothetical protein [Desulfuromonadales bacterium]